MHLKDDCLFCKIISGKIPAQKVLETDTVFAFKDIHPQAPTHILVIPKFHVESLAQLEKEKIGVVADLYGAALNIAELQNFKNSGFRTVINTGEKGGQTVFHLHLHILSGTQMTGKFS